MKSRIGFAPQLAIAVALAIVVPLVLVHGAYGRHLLTLALIFCSLAVSLNLVMGYAGLVSVAHGAFFGIGAYATALITVAGFHFVTSLLAGMLLAAAAGTLVGMLTLRLRGHYFAIGTLAFTMVGGIVLERWESVTRGAGGVSNIPRPSAIDFGIWRVNFAEFWPMYLLTLAVLCLFAFISHRIVHSPFGRGLLCIQRNELLGQVYGVNVVKVKLQTFAISAAMASVSGGFYASYIAYVSPNDANFMRSFEAIMFVVLGGAGTIWGPVAGAFFIQMLPEVLRGLDVVRLLLLGVILIAVVRFYPAGLAGAFGQVAKWIGRRHAVVPASSDAAGLAPGKGGAR